jgi:uncharacterized protein YjlB
MQQYINPEPQILKHILKEDGNFPNSGLFLLIYKDAIKLPGEEASTIFKKIFESNDWKNSWLDGIYDYHHYHSITHEVLGVYQGNANVHFGGPDGIFEDVIKGDVIIIPAGVAHKCNSASNDFKCIGAYPGGSDYDIKKGEPSERQEAEENISKVKLPESDPVYGLNGPLVLNWEMQ